MAPKVKRYKATYSGYYAGVYYESSVVTYNKTRKETIDLLNEETEAPEKLYEGTYKKGSGKRSLLNITSAQYVEQPYRLIRRDVIKAYTRIVRGKKQRVKGYTREYRQYYVPTDEIEHTIEEDIGRGRRRS